jgi:hypothetical protein
VFGATLLALLLWLFLTAADPAPTSASSSPVEKVREAEPRPGQKPPRRKVLPDQNAPVVAEPAQTAPEPLPAKPAERRFLGGRTAAEIVKPFGDAPPRPGRQRFRDDMVAFGPLTQLSDLVAEDFDHAMDAFTNGALAVITKNGGVVDADQRRRFGECERAYWPLIVDLQRRTAGLYTRILDKDYRDDAERAALESRQAEIGDVVDRLYRELVTEEKLILTPAPR